MAQKNSEAAADKDNRTATAVTALAATGRISSGRKFLAAWLSAVWTQQRRLVICAAVLLLLLAGITLPALLGSWRVYHLEPAGISLQLPKKPAQAQITDAAVSTVVLESLSPDLAVIIAGWPAAEPAAGNLQHSVSANMAMTYLKLRPDVSELRYQLTETKLKHGAKVLRVSGTLKLQEVPARVVGLAGGSQERSWHVLTLFTDGDRDAAAKAARILNSIRIN